MSTSAGLLAINSATCIHPNTNSSGLRVRLRFGGDGQTIAQSRDVGDRVDVFGADGSSGCERPDGLVTRGKIQSQHLFLALVLPCFRRNLLVVIHASSSSSIPALSLFPPAYPITHFPSIPLQTLLRSENLHSPASARRPFQTSMPNGTTFSGSTFLASDASKRLSRSIRVHGTLGSYLGRPIGTDASTSPPRSTTSERPRSSRSNSSNLSARIGCARRGSQ